MEIALISASVTLTEKMRELVGKNRLKLDIRQANSRLDALKVARSLVSDGVKVLLARGQISRHLRDKLNIPIVDIRFTHMDCYNAYIKAKKVSDHIAFLATSDYWHKIIEQSKPLIPGARIQRIHTEKDAATIDRELARLKKAGVEVVISGITLKDRVLGKGMRHVMTESSVDVLLDAIEEANHLLRVGREREEQNIELQKRFETIKTILDCTSDGIVSYDEQGIIGNFNDHAAGFFPGIAIGDQVRGILPLRACEEKNITAGTRVFGEMLNVGETSLMINIQPIRMNNNVLGAVATLKKQADIEDMEQKIRYKLLGKGHITNKCFADIIGESPAILGAKALAKKYAEVDSTLLISGETGTGKEMFAQSIHNESARRNSPFVAINCAAFPPSVLESELFGYVKGAFTGAAKEGRVGMFELAHRGTIFLDEISETPLDVQLKLLRVIQERKILRLGDERLIPIDVRIIAATNRDIMQMVVNSRFREDFYYRICVLELKIPALHQRRSDIPALVEYFLDNSRIRKKNISDNALAMLSAMDWPGNIRQLENTVERLVVVSESDCIDENDIRVAIGVEPSVQQKTTTQYQVPPVIDAEERIIRNALLQCKGNRRLAAKTLGISTTTLWRRIKKIASRDPDFLAFVRYGQTLQ